jgi:tripartite-type tricarboxylate transporter receptor subunit TctC
MSIRAMLHCITAVTLSCIIGASAGAQDAANWPSRPVKIIVNYQPGGSTDNATRAYLPYLAAELGQQFVIENRGGAAGAIGLEAAAKSAPDGYTYVTTPVSSVTILPQARTLPFDPFKDLVPVSQFCDYTIILTVHPSVPANNIKELAALSKAKPNSLNFGGVGLGTLTQLIVVMLNQTAGTDMVYIPYRGAGEALPDFLSGAVQAYLDPNALPHVAAGKAKLLAVIDRVRHPDFPNVPLITETYPEMDFVGWFGMFAPAGTPDPIIRKMSAAMAKVGRIPEVQAQLLKLAIRPFPSTPEQLAATMRRDYDRYGKLMRDFQIRMD